MRRRCLACLAANEGRPRYSDICEIDILTVIELEVKFKSHDSLKAVLLMHVFSKYHFNLVTLNSNSESKQNVFISWSNQITPAFMDPYKRVICK